MDSSDNLISEQPVTITVVEGHESGVSEDLYDEVDQDGDGDINLGEIRDGISEWSETGGIGEADADLADIRALVEWWST